MFSPKDFTPLSESEREFIATECPQLLHTSTQLTDIELYQLRQKAEHYYLTHQTAKRDQYLLLILTKKAPYDPFQGLPIEDAELFQLAFTETADALNKGFFEVEELMESLTISPSTHQCPIQPIEKNQLDMALTAAKCMLNLNHWGASKYNSRYHIGGRLAKQSNLIG